MQTDTSAVREPSSNSVLATLHAPSPSQAPAPIATWEESAEINVLSPEEVIHEPSVHEEPLLVSFHPQSSNPTLDATSAVSRDIASSLGFDESVNTTLTVDANCDPSLPTVSTTAGFPDVLMSPYHAPVSHFSLDTASSCSSSAAGRDIGSEGEAAQCDCQYPNPRETNVLISVGWETRSTGDLSREEWDSVADEVFLGGVDYLLPSSWRYSI